MDVTILVLIFILVLLIILTLTAKYTKEEFVSDNYKYNKCSYFYDDERRLRKVKIIPGLLSKTQCEFIIKEGENFASENGWKTSRHDNYPTTDNEITKEWDTYNLIMYKVYEHIIPELSKLFDIEKYLLGIKEIFIAKYTPQNQSKLEKHEDGSELSFVIALNDSYKGGGTNFVKNDIGTIQLKQGDSVVFSGKETHEGLPVICGTRYILTGFIDIFKYDYCDSVLD